VVSGLGAAAAGWLLLTVLLVLAIAASSALVFTDRVELLRLAVIVALWAAVAAAFVSVIYRRQSDIDQARVQPPQGPEPVDGRVPQTDWQPMPADGEWIPAGMPGSNWVSPAVENGSSAESLRGRHSALPDAADPGRPSPPPTLATEPAEPQTPSSPPEADGQHTGGHSVAELLARLQVSSTGGGRRHRREQ
jgi:hypothetical protein